MLDLASDLDGDYLGTPDATDICSQCYFPVLPEGKIS